MSEELIARLKTRKRFRDLPSKELQRVAILTTRLRKIAVFEPLSDFELAFVAEKGVVQHNECGDVVIRQGDTDKAFYIILKGQVRVWNRDERGGLHLLNYHEADDFFGELAPLHGKPRSANVDVVDDADLVVFQPEGFERILAHPQISQYLRTWGQERIRRSNRPFEGKHWDEITVVQAHKSWVAMLRMSLLPAFVIVLSLGIWLLLSTSARVSFPVATSLFVAVTVGMGLWIFWMWEDWRNDDLIVTSKRVIHIERILVPPFPVERHEAFVDHVQDITTRNHGVWTWLFRVHTLEIKTAGAGTIRFPYLDDTDQIREEVFKARRLALTQRRGEERSRIRHNLLTELKRPVDEVTPLESVDEAHVTPERTGLLRLVDYFVPRTRIIKRDQIIWRKHWLVLAKAVWAPLLSFLAALVALGLAFLRPGILRGLSLSFAVPLPALLVLVSLGWYLWRYDGWRNDVYIVADTRIVDIEGSPFHLYKEKRTEGTFDIIQNTDASSPNWLARVLRIGDVTLDTAAQQEAFTFYSVARPEEVQQEIFKRLTAFRERQARAEQERRHDELTRWFGIYHRSMNTEEE